MAEKESFLYKLLKLPGMGALWLFEGMIRLVQPDPPFYDPADFPWTRKLEDAYPEIRDELMGLLANRDSIPNLQEIFREQEQLTQGEDWKSHMMYMYGYRIDKNCDSCPKTDALLRKIPGMRTAMFSILAPGKHIPAHRGPFKGVLRYHLGLIVPMEPGLCRIRVGKETRDWKEGESLVLDDTQEHEAWNDTEAHRAILFMDVKRKLPAPISWISNLLYALLRRSPFVKNVVRSLK